VAVLGDNQYESGLLSEYNGPGAYNDTWGQFNSIVRPAPGNHEYAASSTASGYFTYFGSSAGSGSYSYDLGSWHIISLNSNCSDSGCSDLEEGTTSSAQVSWLQNDLAAHQHQCTLAYWHHPRFTSGFVPSSPGVAPFWSALYAAHADVVLNGHDHLYERFAPQDPAQNPTSQGIREFVVGTGGQELDPSMRAAEPNMQIADNHHFGVLFLTLQAGSYGWVFRSVNGTVLDSGSTPCHG
jgi:acid phosphatase type 7